MLAHEHQIANGPSLKSREPRYTLGMPVRPTAPRLTRGRSGWRGTPIGSVDLARVFRQRRARVGRLAQVSLVEEVGRWQDPSTAAGPRTTLPS
jgi:hypothetical protein